jgi:hypothetical protein
VKLYVGRINVVFIAAMATDRADALTQFHDHLTDTTPMEQRTAGAGEGAVTEAWRDNGRRVATFQAQSPEHAASMVRGFLHIGAEPLWSVDGGKSA